MYFSHIKMIKKTIMEAGEGFDDTVDAKLNEKIASGECVLYESSRR